MSLQPRRFEYVLVLGGSSCLHPAPASVRHPSVDDVEGLAALMLEAYRGTIDYAGEGLEEARAEVRTYFAFRPLLGCSWLQLERGAPVAACLVTDWKVRQSPLIAYVMTHPEWKKQGLARRLVELSLESLRAASHAEVRAVITEGNEPSERLFTRLGFVVDR